MIYLFASLILPVIDIPDHVDEEAIEVLTSCQIPSQYALRERLSLFGVYVENNLDYYLSCLYYLQEQCSPDFETIAHVYEQVQSRYDENEEFVEYVTDHSSRWYVNLAKID